MTTDNLTRLIVFALAVGSLQLAVDWYVLSAWRRFVRRRAWWGWLYRVPIALGVIMLPMFALTLWLRQTQQNPSQMNRTLHVMLAIWYMPKLLLALSLMVHHGLRWCGRVIVPVLKRLMSRLASLTTTGLQALQSILQNAFQNTFRKPFQNLLRKRSLAAPEIASFPEPLPTLFTVPRSPSRRAFLQQLGKAAHGVAVAAPVAAIGYDAIRLLDEFEIHRVEIPLRGLPRQFDGFTITQISDLHAGSFFSIDPLKELRRIVEDLKSDVVMITGDWVNFRARELPFILPEIKRLCVSQMRSRFGVYGSLGNHDHYAHALDLKDLMGMIREAGVHLLVNQNTTLTVDGATLQLAGNDNVGLRQNYGNLSKTLESLLPEHPTIVMAHDPTIWDRQIHGMTTTGANGDMKIDLTLAGHTHGGQFGVRAFGVELSPATFIYKQSAGLYTSNDGSQHIYVNRGIGATGIPFRIGIPPEVTVITLRKA